MYKEVIRRRNVARGEILAELESIKAQIRTLAEKLPMGRDQLYAINERIARLEESTKSAHHRLDEFKHDVCWTIGMSTTIVGIFASILTWALGGR
jgi:chromosome segregation ATPase